MLNEAIEFLKMQREQKQEVIFEIDVRFKEIRVDLKTIKTMKDLWVSIDLSFTYHPYRINSYLDDIKIYASVNKEELQHHFPDLAKEVLGDVSTGLDIDQ